MTCGAALALWRGPALEGVQSDVIRSAATRLNELWIAAFQDCLELQPGLGLHQEIIGELTDDVAEHPLNERLRGQLMLALYRGGPPPWSNATTSARLTRRPLPNRCGIRAVDGIVFEIELACPGWVNGATVSK